MMKEFRAMVMISRTIWMLVRVFIVVLLSFVFLMIARVTVKLVMNNADRQTVLFV